MHAQKGKSEVVHSIGSIYKIIFIYILFCVFKCFASVYICAPLA